MNKRKTIIAVIGMFSTYMAAHAQTNSPTPLANVAAGLPPATNVAYAMAEQVLYNPGALYVVMFLCVMAWLADETPIIPSKYVLHLTVVLGASIYWLYALPSSVPATFPHPAAVFFSNGVICGFIAFIIHRQAVARVINLVRGNLQGTTMNQSKDDDDARPTKPPMSGIGDIH